jgi:hypothetical protein
MPNFYRNSLIVPLLLVLPTIGYAVSTIKDADAVITMRNGNPCFSYPIDKQILKRPFSFGRLSVGTKGPKGDAIWIIEAIDIASIDLIEPNNIENCIEYGATPSGTKIRFPAEPLEMNTPYYGRLHLYSKPASEWHYQRKYMSNFCVVTNEKKQTTIAWAAYNEKTHRWECLQPGQSPKRSFWKKLFGGSQLKSSKG